VRLICFSLCHQLGSSLKCVQGPLQYKQKFSRSLDSPLKHLIYSCFDHFISSILASSITRPPVTRPSTQHSHMIYPLGNPTFLGIRPYKTARVDPPLYPLDAFRGIPVPKSANQECFLGEFPRFPISRGESTESSYLAKRVLASGLGWNSFDQCYRINWNTPPCWMISPPDLYPQV